MKKAKRFFLLNIDKTSLRGFTLIELLVVLAVIGLLVSLVLVSLTGVRSKARDGKRASEIDTLRTALEFYYNEHNRYPDSGSEDLISLEADAEADGPVSQALAKWMPLMPKDPLYPKEDETGKYSYQYLSATSDSYVLCVNLETAASYCYSSSEGTIILSVTTGFKSPTATGGKGEAFNTWANPTYAYVKDGNYTTVSSDGSIFYEQSYENFGFNIPKGATINGIEVRVKGYVSPDTSFAVGVYSSIDDRWTRMVVKDWSDEDEEHLLPKEGGSTYLWFRNWSPDALSDENFSASIRIGSKLEGHTWYVDFLQVKVYYTTE